MKFRWMHKLYAKVFGYFWLPCPVCGEYFGGHEVTRETPSVQVGSRALLVCPKRECANEAISHNLAEWYKVPYWRRK
jgi:hypothetical protein